MSGEIQARAAYNADAVSALLVVALLVALGVIVWLLIRHAVYRATHKWSDADLKAARHESVNRSRSVVSGRVQEHMAPLCPEFFEQFNPKDARFLGTPIDFVVFDGLDEGDVRQVCFVEVKTGRSGLSSRERHVREAVEAGKVSFQVMRLPGAAPQLVLPNDGATEERLDAPRASRALQP
jgi:predicted Holliday junction resolvase-like endonuclease